jgi:hypothetical protein
VGTLHLSVYELLVLLVVPVAIEVPASVGGGGARSILGLLGRLAEATSRVLQIFRLSAARAGVRP